jgi:hypothetical protein
MSTIDETFVCKRCGHNAKYKQALQKHLLKLNVCLPTKSNVSVKTLLDELAPKYGDNAVNCDYCNKKFNNNFAKNAHQRTCKKQINSYKYNTIGNGVIEIDRKELEMILKRLDLVEKEQDILKRQLDYNEKELACFRRFWAKMSNTHSAGGPIETSTSRLDRMEDILNRVVIALDRRTQLNQNKPEKTAHKGLKPRIRRSCWNKYIGEDIGKIQCLCCNINEITPFTFHCGHVVAIANGGSNNIDNLRPICATCNSAMGTDNMIEFAKLHYNIEISN